MSLYSHTLRLPDRAVRPSATTDVPDSDRYVRYSGDPARTHYGTLIPGLPDVDCPYCELPMLKPGLGRERKVYRCEECGYYFEATRARAKHGGRRPFLPEWPRVRMPGPYMPTRPRDLDPDEDEIEARCKVMGPFRLTVTADRYYGKEAHDE